MDSSFFKQNTLPGFTQEEEEEGPPLPEKIGPYKVESLLNKGGMSLLYLGIDPKTKAPLAIKVLSPKFLDQKKAVERFLKEVEIITLTSHPNIVKIFGDGKWEGGLYLSMELIQGVSLKQFIIQHSLSLKRALEIVLQVSYALCHLHTHGVIHRDLKPENILINEEGEVKVIDFGIAGLHTLSKAEKIEGEKDILGTPHYMSPEQKEGAAKATFVSDIYSLGVITYELAIGKLSFGIINTDFLPKNLRRIVEKALAPSPKERYSDIVDFITDLSDYLKSKELENERPGTDQFQELLEQFHLAEIGLTPRSFADTPSFEIGLAKQKELGQIGYYYNLFSLPNNFYAFILGRIKDESFASSIHLAHIAGLIEALMYEQEQNETPFTVSTFCTTLNALATNVCANHPFGLSLLVLSPRSEELAYISFDEGSLFHLPQGSRLVRELSSENPTLESGIQTELAIATDNWNIGDTLVLSSFTQTQTEQNKTLFMQAIQGSTALSSSSQAETILKSISSTDKNTSSPPHVAITIRRIG